MPCALLLLRSPGTSGSGDLPCELLSARACSGSPSSFSPADMMLLELADDQGSCWPSTRNEPAGLYLRRRLG